MAVGLWAVLGLVLVLLGLPLAFFTAIGGEAVAAGVAFLIVATVEWGLARSAAATSAVDPDLVAPP